MKVKEMIEELEKLPQDMEIVILDGFNGGGQPRTINYGPLIYNPAKWQFEGNENNDYSDLDAEDGAKIVQMGYGFY